MRAKETLQLRHQLSASGLSFRAATYDTKRHHVLTFDSHPLRPHVLRLFSLRRELKSVPLFDKRVAESATKREKRPSSSNSSPAGATQGHKRPSFFELQLQQEEKRLNQCNVEVVVPLMLLQYSVQLDVFICVYSKATRPRGATKVPKTTSHYVLLLEAATLRKLLIYKGPETQLLQCAHYDPLTDRLVLASHLKSGEGDGPMLPKAPKNVVEILQLSKRPDDRQEFWSTDLRQDQEQPRMLLFIENTRASLRYPDALTVICGSKGLCELYGATSDCSTSTDSVSTLLEWRQKQPNVGKLVLVRRVLLRHRLTAMAVSPCGDWLLAGFCTGGLKVWNVNGSRTNGSGVFTIDAEPYSPTVPNVADAQAQVISSIEVITTSSPNSTGTMVGLTDLIVIAAERETGAVRHWKFSAERKMLGSGNDANAEEHRYPRLDLVGYFSAGGKKQGGKEDNSTKFKLNQDTLGPALKTLVMCVTIDMGSCFENLLLVVHEDVIHVLKVQTVLYVMQEFASIEEVYAVRGIMQQDESKVISLSNTAASKLRMFALDNTSSEMPSSRLLCVPPQASDISANVSSMETVANERMQLSFVVLAWSSGVVNVYDVLRETYVMQLQDKRLTDQISALSVVTFSRATTLKAPVVLDVPEEDGFLSSRSSWSLSQNYTGNLPSYTTADKSNDATRRKIFIVVGTESGKLFGWNAGALWDDDLTFQSIQKANIYVKAAHSSHVIQLARIDASIHGERALLASAGAGGVIKLWSVPSLKMIGHVNSIAEGYPVTPSCLELLNGAGFIKGRELYATVGYEDGRVAVWSIDFKQVSFQRLDASTRHERRVTKLCRISNDTVSTGVLEFLSCSLDMTVIQWQISGSGSVQEKRYFDIGAAIVDMILIQEQAVVALAHEICKFEFAPRKNDMKYIIKPGTEINVEGDELGSEEQNYAAPPSDDGYPDTPTTRSVEDPTEVVTPSRRSRLADEYLTLHVPSAVFHFEAADTATDSAPATKEQNEDFVHSRIENADKMPRYMRGTKSADKLKRPSVNDDILREYLQEYIARHGTGGTMAADRITHLLALRPELPSVKRPGFALTKSLKDLKLSTQARLDSEEALQILRLLFAMPTVSNSSFDAPTMMRDHNEIDHKSERASAQRLREKKQARRKPVVTYNLLGEKYVRWEENPAEQERVERNQSPSGPTNSFVLHTPPSPNMRAPSGFEKNSPPDGNVFSEAPSQEAPNLTTKNEGVVSNTPSIHSPSRPLPTDSASPEAPPSEYGKHIATNSLSIESNQSNSDEDSNVDNEDEDEDDDNGDDDQNDTDSDNDDESGENDYVALKEQNHVEMMHPVLKEATRTEAPVKKSFRCRRYNDSSSRIFENALVNNIRLSPMFQQFWTKGYCWCWSASRLHIIWTSEVKPDNESSQNGNTKVTRRDQNCEACQKRLHTIELPRVRYAPHFSRQTTFDIIVEVYSKLTATAHSRLYKNGSTKIEHAPECSIFSALYKVFLTTYGMRNTVEKKLKLFFVSMCHFMPEYDAIAVFGELLGLHNPDIVDEYDHAPSTLVALCVCCYSWLYSRGMVVNGDLFSDRLRGREWENSHKSATIEVLPATDGTTHWQFVRVEHALLCAQENLLYPLVSPGFLQNFMGFMQEYAQHAPTRSLRTDSPYFTNDGIVRNEGTSACWIELHRFLRLLVGEWKQQNAEFRVVERLLFVYPQRDAAIEGYLLEKLRLMLSCFVFYDHERVGVMTISDFETLLFKLRYLWAEECMTEDSALVTISAIKKRFVDLDHDGQLCYLDFWVMVYIVGVKTRSLISFHELPSFCRDYKLEISSELSDMVWNYMQLSCTLLLPKGFQVGKSSMDQKAKRQHRRRVGGLHDGTFHFSKTLQGSLSTQELLEIDNTKKRGLFLDGSVPATRQTASTTALDRFRPVSIETEFGFDNSSRQRGREPVVVGVRSTGPTPKPVAPLRVSILGNCDFLGTTTNAVNYAKTQNDTLLSLNRTPLEKSKTGYTNIHIQFPLVPPVRWRVGLNEVAARQIVGKVLKEVDNDSDRVIYEDSTIGQKEVPVEIIPPDRESMRPLSSRSAVSVTEAIPLVQEELVAVEQSKPKSPLDKRRSATPVVVVPTVEAEAPITPTKSRNDLPKPKSSPELARVVSELIRLEEAVPQLKPEKVSPPRQSTPVATAREESSPEIDRVESQSVISNHTGSEVDAADVEQSIEPVDNFPQEEVNEPLSIIVEEVLPEPEPMEQTYAESIEPVVVQPNIEEEHVVESPIIIDEPSEQVVDDDAEHTEIFLDEEVFPIPTPPSIAEPFDEPFDEPVPIQAPAPEPDATSEIASEEELSENSDDDTQYTPQVVKEDDIQVHNAYRFSQQPTFLSSVAVANKLNRPVMWNPNDDSDDDDTETSNEVSNTFSTKSGYLDVNESKHSKEGEYTSVALHLDLCTTSSSKISSSQFTRFDSRLPPSQSDKRDKKATPVEHQVFDGLDSIHDDGSDDPGATTDIPLIPFKRKRLDEDAERALYGERILNVLGEGIAFSQEAEAAMQQKWQQFFDGSESKMFATMRHDLEKKQMEQREAEERQKKLRKKWQEQRDQDLLRLQHSRHNSTLLMSTKQAEADNGTVDAGFRLRRIHRESCRQLTEELQFGVSVQREIKDTKRAQFFHFYYIPEGHGTIITLKMHVLRGDAEVFMSTDTKVPCATDFKWRSSERLTNDSGEGHRIILYPHDLQKAVTTATANVAATEQVTMVEANSTASLRSLYPKQTDVNTPKVGFYLSVVALEPDTTVTIAVMSSGQKMEQSRAIQTVDYLIDRFNMISRSFQGQSTISFTSSNDASRRENRSSDDNESDAMDEDEGDDNDDTTVNELTKATDGRRKTKKIAGDGVDPQQLKSFQYLLETLSEKKGFGPPRAASILLAGPSEEHLEFVQDEDQRLQEMHRRLSPPKTCPELHDPISVVTERRLTLQGKRQKLRRVVAARLQQKLAPLHHKSVGGGELEKSASTGALVNIRLANAAPHPVAYSITTLDPLPRSQRFKAANLSRAHTKHDTVSTDNPSR